MKAKTIKKVIQTKIDGWIETIEDEDLRADVAKDVIVTGGCIASMLLGEKVNDFDIYLRTKSTLARLASYYVDKFKRQKHAGIDAPIEVHALADRVSIVVKSAGIASEQGTEIPYQYFEGRPDEEADSYVGAVIDDPAEIEEKHEEIEQAALENDAEGYKPVFLTTNAITLSGRIQIVTRFFGEPEEIHANYDFVHCTNYWTSKDNKLVLHQDALESLLTKELRYVGSKYPLCSIIRIRKFVQRGWTVNAGQILKMVMQLNELDLLDINVLKDQLVGVDAAYFMQLIERLKERDPDKVNAAYLVEIIDRLF